MAFDDIHVSVSGLEGVSSDFAGQAEQLDLMLRHIQAQIQATSETWTGQAASHFQELMAQWTSDMSSIQRILLEVSAHVAQAGQQFGEVDQGLAQRFGSYGS